MLKSEIERWGEIMPQFLLSVELKSSCLVNLLYFKIMSVYEILTFVIVMHNICHCIILCLTMTNKKMA